MELFYRLLPAELCLMGSSLIFAERKMFYMEMEDILRIKKAIILLSPSERDHYLQRFLVQSYRLQHMNPTGSTADLLEDYLSLYKELLQRSEPEELYGIHPSCTHVHIVFGDSVYGVMKMVLESNGLFAKQKIIVLHENYAIGPLCLNTREGRFQRSTWFKHHIAEAENLDSDESDIEQAYLELLDQVASITPEAQVIIWADDNEVEEIGLRHAVYLLKDLPNQIVWCNPCVQAENLYTLDHPESMCKYRHSGEIGVRAMEYVLHHMEHAVVLSSEYRQQLAAEWTELSSHSSVLRILEKGRIVHVSPDYFDYEILRRLDAVSTYTDSEGYEFCRATRIVGEVLGHSDHVIGDYYYEYRLREMIYSGILEIQGIPAAMRYYSVRRKSKSLI